MKALLVIDSFKGCLSSAQAEQAASSAFAPSDDTVCLPVSDGGEGFSGIMTRALGGRTLEVEVHDPLGRRIIASYGICGDTAILDSASASGLCLMSETERDIMNASSRGTGEMIADAVRRGVSRVFLGLGGTGTNDGGKGMLDAIAGSGISLDGVSFTGLCDVSAPFCGPQGASFVFGPQKGASPSQVEILDKRLEELSHEYYKVLGRDVLSKPGAGAAGGIGGALWAVLGGELRSGADAVLDLLHFEEQLYDADLVVTGEGCLDVQTFTGKLPFAVASRVRAFESSSGRRIKIVALTGRLDLAQDDRRLSIFDLVRTITPEGTPQQLAMDPDFASTQIVHNLRDILDRTVRVS